MPFRHPFQKLCTISHANGQLLLLAASGPTINCISLSDGKLLYQWPSEYGAIDETSGQEDDSPSHKRRKLDANGRSVVSRQQSEASDASIEIVAERKKGERKKTKIIDTKLPNVSHLLATSDGKYAIAVTAEDKCIRVFEINRSGTLTVQSQRCLPKKLCALQLTKNEETILAADKFGDVYAVPLHQSEGWKPKPKPNEDLGFKPAATELTVHTRGNLEALRQQQELKQRNPKKEGPNFEHQILLGHVSLLTDLTVGEAEVKGKRREFILTSDRDEHIRVSRGIPQAHIIEGFCLGHQEFVTKLCIPTSQPETLIAGNGEATIRVYDWRSGRYLQKKKLSPAIPTSLMVLGLIERSSTLLPEGRTTEKLAVSGIWTMQAPDPFITGRSRTLVLVAIEGIPMLEVFTMSEPGSMVGFCPIGLGGNVLDVTVLEATQQILVSIDNVHKPFSMRSYREAVGEPETLLQLFKLELTDPVTAPAGPNSWKLVDHPFNASEIVTHLPEIEQQAKESNEKSKGHEKIFSNLGEFLYGLENLRKKRDATAEDDEVQMEGEIWGTSTVAEYW